MIGFLSVDFVSQLYFNRSRSLFPYLFLVFGLTSIVTLQFYTKKPPKLLLFLLKRDILDMLYGSIMLGDLTCCRLKLNLVKSTSFFLSRKIPLFFSAEIQRIISPSNIENYSAASELCIFECVASAMHFLFLQKF